MPGGNGLTALNYVSEVAPEDGTVLTLVIQTLPVEQALGLCNNLKIDLSKLNWLGNMSELNTFLLTSHRPATRTIADAKQRMHLDISAYRIQDRHFELGDVSLLLITKI